MVRGWPGLRVADAPAIERHSLDQRIELLALGELQVDARAPGDPGYERGRADTELGLDDRTARIGDRDQRSPQYIDDAHAFRASQRQRYVACANAHADALVFAVNQRAWNALNEGDRKILREAAKDMKRVSLLSIAPDALAALCLYTWPGNVRQLQNVVQRLVAGVTHGHLITVSEVNQALREVASFEANPQVPLMFREEDSLDEFLDRIVLGLYNHFRALTGNHADAARLMRVDRNSLYSRLRRARRRMNGNGSNGKGSMTEEEWLD